MGNSLDDEAPLLPSEAVESEPDAAPHRKQGPSKRRAIEITSFVASLCLNAVLILGVAVLLIQRQSMIEWKGARPIYTPAHEFIEHKLVRFDPLGHAKTPYDGPPSPEVDAAWKGLYHNSVVGIPKEQAALLSNRTEAFTGDESHYITQLDVYHQIHCLNNIRKLLWPDYYPEIDHLRYTNFIDGSVMDHFDHCVGSIRQSLMCNADVTAIPWRWDTRYNVSTPDFDVLHTCKNWERLREWTTANKAKLEIDINHHVVDDLKFLSDP
ncbi:hypothetical protein HWV62_34137 [Athelia sp. TMB]|nr:hypothetical protein HWV62_34137 [Athelia sp. TMB]